VGAGLFFPFISVALRLHTIEYKRDSVHLGVIRTHRNTLSEGLGTPGNPYTVLFVELEFKSRAYTKPLQAKEGLVGGQVSVVECNGSLHQEIDFGSGDNTLLSEGPSKSEHL